ncbi:MAG TPA: hypothetical protein VM936_05815 [Pyrinomonadaceae bacterium]|nr:hypothetical protein [Pyrinomonadaceae bacterium]
MGGACGGWRGVACGAGRAAFGRNVCGVAAFRCRAFGTGCGL